MKIKYLAHGLLKLSFQAVGDIIPAVKRYEYRTKARRSFEIASGLSCPGLVDPISEQLKSSLLNDTKEFLVSAGEDVNSNKAYVSVLGLQGGKKEFDQLFPKDLEVDSPSPS